jgi:aerobic carbon-monoxide dehydrogenase small subunit
MSSVSDRVRVDLKVNGKSYAKETEARRTLADFLREDLGLTGTHLGCEHGACGACTVTIDGNLARSCLTLAVQAQGVSVRTVEGMAGETGLHPLQKAFKQHHALQCGYCTPGFLVTAAVLLDTIPDPTELQVREWLSGNICRCTGYQFIVDAVLAAAQEMKGDMRS